MKTTKSALPVASSSSQNLAQFDELSRALAQAKNPAEKLKIAFEANKMARHYDLEGIYEMVFKYASLYCRAEFSLSKDTVGMDRHFQRKDKDRKSAIKKAYSNLSLHDFEAKIQFAKENNIVPTREWFLKRGWVGNSGDDEYYTPREIIEASRHVLHGIDLDPASNPTAQKIVQAHRYFTKEDDGLKQKWSGSVFLNPPFSNLEGFADKLISELKNVREAIFIGRMDVGTRWGQKIMQNSNSFCVPKRRIQFYGPNGISKGNNNMANIIFGLKVSPAYFEHIFKKFGVVTHRMFAPPFTKEEIQKAIYSHQP